MYNVFMLMVNFTGKPSNYAQISDKVSRSAQPSQDDFVWLKNNGVTDIINFRTMGDPGINFDEKSTVENLGLKYHNIPTYTRHPKDKQVVEFLHLVDSITKTSGNVHIHCKAGADRTGMYSFIYKTIKNMGSNTENINEWISHGLHQKLYPNLIQWAQDCATRIKIWA